MILWNMRIWMGERLLQAISVEKDLKIYIIASIQYINDANRSFVWKLLGRLSYSCLTKESSI